VVEVAEEEVVEEAVPVKALAWVCLLLSLLLLGYYLWGLFSGTEGELTLFLVFSLILLLVAVLFFREVRLERKEMEKRDQEGDEERRG